MDDQLEEARRDLTIARKQLEGREKQIESRSSSQARPRSRPGGPTPHVHLGGPTTFKISRATSVEQGVDDIEIEYERSDSVTKASLQVASTEREGKEKVSLLQQELGKLKLKHEKESADHSRERWGWEKKLLDQRRKSRSASSRTQRTKQSDVLRARRPIRSRSPLVKAEKDIGHDSEGGKRKVVKLRDPAELEKAIAEWEEEKLAIARGKLRKVHDDDVEEMPGLEEGETDIWYNDSDWEWCGEDHRYYFIGEEDGALSESDSEPEDGYVTHLQSVERKGDTYLSITDVIGVKIGQHWTINAGNKNE